MTLIRHTDDYGRVIFDSTSAFELLYAGHKLEDILIIHDEALQRRNEWLEHFDQDKFRSKPIPIITDYDVENFHIARLKDWNLPGWLEDCDVRSILHDLCKRDDEHKRVDYEMDLFESRNMRNVLLTLMMLVFHWRENNILWGVGRGSSVASYCLYLLDVHRIDSILYDLDIHEFLR